ncbi:hypothetical protein, partial [Deinococcus wulumuqiensis]|uniref:hypothetical protein n=1 Tax=Deinococcus wulumuqiensis TaxID=980427 RepID=UPI001CEF9A29
MHRRRFPDCAGIKRNPYYTSPGGKPKRTSQKEEARAVALAPSIRRAGQRRFSQALVSIPFISFSMSGTLFIPTPSGPVAQR